MSVTLVVLRSILREIVLKTLVLISVGRAIPTPERIVIVLVNCCSCVSLTTKMKYTWRMGVPIPVLRAETQVEALHGKPRVVNPKQILMQCPTIEGVPTPVGHPRKVRAIRLRSGLADIAVPHRMMTFLSHPVTLHRPQYHLLRVILTRVPSLRKSIGNPRVDVRSVTIFCVVREKSA